MLNNNDTPISNTFPPEESEDEAAADIAIGELHAELEALLEDESQSESDNDLNDMEGGHGGPGANFRFNFVQETVAGAVDGFAENQTQAKPTTQWPVSNFKGPQSADTGGSGISSSKTTTVQQGIGGGNGSATSSTSLDLGFVRDMISGAVND